MEWIKRGKIFDPTSHGLNFDCIEFAQSPQTLVCDEFVRIYFSTRKKDASGKFISIVAFVDFDKQLENIVNFSKQPVLELGSLGNFDEHGIFPINPVRNGTEIWAYTCGWSRRVSVSVETSTGLAISVDEGETFKNMGPGPVLTSSIQEPMLVGDSFVRIYNNQFHMWYIFGKYWLKATESEPPARVYKIAYATSTDGINWKKNEANQIIKDVLNEHECQALPTVIKLGESYHMFFCYREATDFRKNAKRGYQLGYAFSTDLINWQRDDKNKGIELSATGWDSEMMCYPHIFNVNDKVYLLYNGNEFGRFGFGLAELRNH